MIEELMNNAVLLALVLAPITTGLIEVVKGVIDIDKRYLPLISLIVAVVIALGLALLTSQDLVQYTLAGIIGGLGSSGLYDQKDIAK